MTSPANITALAFSPSGAYCAVASSETIYIWQVTTKLFCILYVGSSVWQYPSCIHRLLQEICYACSQDIFSQSPA